MSTFKGFIIPSTVANALMNPSLLSASAQNIVENLDEPNLEKFRAGVEYGLKKVIDPYISVKIMDSITREEVQADAEPYEFHFVLAIDSSYHSYGRH